jgi:6-phosphogluconolactonase (cycloisomerase 2 family)
LGPVRFDFLLRNVFAVLVASLFLSACGGQLAVSPKSQQQSSATVASQTRFVYAVGTDEPATVYGYRYTQNGLQPLFGFPFKPIETDDAYVELEADVRGRFLFVGIAHNCWVTCNSVPGIVTYRIDPTSGELTFSSRVDIAQTQSRMILAPNGRDLYVNDAEGISHYAIDPVNGTLTLRQKLSLESDRYLRLRGVDARGNFLIASAGGPIVHIRTISIDADSGDLSTLNVSVPNTIVYSNGAQSTPDGRFIIMSGSGPHSNLEIYRLTGDGALRRVGSPGLIGDEITELSVLLDGQGKYFYALPHGGSGGIHAFFVDGVTGELHPVPSGGIQTPLLTGYQPMAASADGKMIFALGLGPDYGVRQFTTTDSGTLAELSGSGMSSAFPLDQIVVVNAPVSP